MRSITFLIGFVIELDVNKAIVIPSIITKTLMMNVNVNDRLPRSVTDLACALIDSIRISDSFSNSFIKSFE